MNLYFIIGHKKSPTGCCPQDAVGWHSLVGGLVWLLRECVFLKVTALFKSSSHSHLISGMPSFLILSKSVMNFTDVL